MLLKFEVFGILEHLELICVPGGGIAILGCVVVVVVDRSDVS